VNLAFTPDGWDDYRWWQDRDRKTLERLNRLLDGVLWDPSSGIGKPEMLQHALAGAYSRRITGEHRPVYRVKDGQVIVMQARYHY
jgi:toxin YoeB